MAENPTVRFDLTGLKLYNHWDLMQERFSHCLFPNLFIVGAVFVSSVPPVSSRCLRLWLDIDYCVWEMVQPEFSLLLLIVLHALLPKGSYNTNLLHAHCLSVSLPFSCLSVSLTQPLFFTQHCQPSLCACMDWSWVLCVCWCCVRLMQIKRSPTCFD